VKKASDRWWAFFYKNLEKLSDLAEAYANANLENKRRIFQAVFNNGVFLTKQGYETPELNELLARPALIINKLHLTKEQKIRESLEDSLSGSGDRTRTLINRNKLTRLSSLKNANQ
jgi:hypothetical protein